MSNVYSPTYVIERTFADVDDLAAEARQWDLDFRQIEKGRFQGEMLQFAYSGVHIAEARFCRSLNQKGAPPAGLRTIALPACRDLRLEWRGKAVDSDCVMLFPRGSELSSVSGADFHVYTCSFPEELLAEVGDSLEFGDIDALARGAEAIRVNSAGMENLRRLLQLACDSVRTDPDGLGHRHANRLISETLPTEIFSLLASERTECAYTVRPKRQIAIAKAEKYIEANAANEIGVGDIAKAADISERTLQYAFVERFGIGPAEYLKAFRLTAARRRLRSADPRSTRVADVANALGFWHMGQFAADYRSRFEELPSETLQRLAGK